MPSAPHSDIIDEDLAARNSESKFPHVPIGKGNQSVSGFKGLKGLRHEDIAVSGQCCTEVITVIARISAHLQICARLRISTPPKA